MVVFYPQGVQVPLSPLLLANLAPLHHPGQTLGHPPVIVSPVGIAGLELVMVVGDNAGEGVPIDDDAVGRPPRLFWGRKARMEKKQYNLTFSVLML